jgi:hypothetical protein
MPTCSRPLGFSPTPVATIFLQEAETHAHRRVTGESSNGFPAFAGRGGGEDLDNSGEPEALVALLREQDAASGMYATLETTKPPPHRGVDGSSSAT